MKKTTQIRLSISLLAAGADANTRDVPSGSPLMWQRLWDRLRGKSTPTPPAPSALLLAVQGMPVTEQAPESILLVKALLDRGANVNARDESGSSALISAAIGEHPAVIQLLLERGAAIYLKDNGDEMKRLAATNVVAFAPQQELRPGETGHSTRSSQPWSMVPSIFTCGTARFA